jgi:hypothetical protein
MGGFLVLTLTLFLVAESSRAEETTTSKASSTPRLDPDVYGGSNEKISRRLIDDRLTPPRAADYSLWNNDEQPLSDLRQLDTSPPRVLDNLHDNLMEKSVLQKTRTAVSIKGEAPFFLYAIAQVANFPAK